MLLLFSVLTPTCRTEMMKGKIKISQLSLFCNMKRVKRKKMRQKDENPKVMNKYLILRDGRGKIRKKIYNMRKNLHTLAEDSHTLH